MFTSGGFRVKHVRQLHSTHGTGMAGVVVTVGTVKVV